jgi:putative DNA primase/helicase
MTGESTAKVIGIGRARELVEQDSPDELGERDFTHDGLALALGDEWRDIARHVDAWGRWLFFDGTVWRVDDRLEHMTRAREFLRERALTLGPKDDSIAHRLRQADTVAKVIGLARSNAAQVATVDQWDADPWLLGTPGGTVDLRTGAMRAAGPGDYITKTAAVAPAPAGTPALLWEATLARITGGDSALQSYLQRFFGYALTGVIREHVFAFGYGTGANGKGVTLNTMAGVFGDYALAIPTEMLVVSQHQRHPEELARLRGVRLAIGSETEEGTRWAESRIKRLTGGDPIPARYMRQNTFEFEPEFKLFIIGNHRPTIRGVDEAMSRRLHLVPFTVTIPEHERDPELPAKLRNEWPAVLRWAIDGCLAWQRDGLNPPDAIRAATDTYLATEDAVSLWMEECATVDAGAWASSGELFANWKRWADAAGEFVGTQKRFATAIQERGCTPKRQPGTGLRGFTGLRVNADDSTPRWEP